MITNQGWNTWDVNYVNAMVHLPSKLRVRFGLFGIQTGRHQETFDWRTGLRALGSHASSGSYCKIHLRDEDAVVTFEYAADADRLACRFTPNDAAREHLLSVVVDGAWGAEVDTTGLALRASSRALQEVPVSLAGMQAFNLTEPLTLGISFDEPLPSPGAAQIIARQRGLYETNRLRSGGWLQDAADGLTRCIHWNTIWEPFKERICTPVSRDWCKDPEGTFGSYVLFDWDTFFCAIMAQMEDPALAVANVHAILQELTPGGFVPNFGSANARSDDRSQPPVGAYCVLKLYYATSLGDPNRALLDETFATLLGWHNWWLPNRDGNGNGLLEWGSDPLPPDPTYKTEAGNLKAAMYESGLDNSPMWDDTVYNEDAHTMELTAVGLNALYALDAWALAEIARIIGREEAAEQLSEEYETVKARINAELWDEEAGIYKNKHWDGQFSPRLSPTCFYPLIAGVAPPDRAERMVKAHLMNRSEFWGQYVISSIASDDPAYPDQAYWRGRIWAPMNFLVAEGLRRYRFDDSAQPFAQRGLSLFLEEWYEESHVHENYNAETGDGDDVHNSDPVYTWGALLAYIAMQELADPEAWGGWRFGNISMAPASVQGIRVGGGIMDVETGTGGLHVRFDDATLLATNSPALVTGFQKTAKRLVCRITNPNLKQLQITLGHLPPGRAIDMELNDQDVQMNTDTTGALTFDVSLPADLALTWK